MSPYSKRVRTKVNSLLVRQTTHHRFQVEIVLAEANIPHKKYLVDLHDKPEWYVSMINPEGKVSILGYKPPDYTG